MKAGAYDSEATWTPEEAKELLRKLDFKILPYAGLLYLFSFLDRVNIGNARLAKLEVDIGLTPSQYSWCLSIFFVGYVIFEVPSNLLLKKYSPSRWIARIMVTWGTCTMCMAAVKNFPGMMVCRLFLGISEAGLFPGIVFYLTFWYTRREQCSRVALFFSAATLAGAFGGVLAYGITHMDGISGISGWQWIFIIEGAPTVILGVVTWFYLPNSPSTAKWLTPRQRELVELRLAQDQMAVSSSHFDKQQFIEAITDVKVWMYAFLYIGILLPLYSLALLLPTIVRDLGFTNVTAQLLTAPPYAFGFVFTIGMAFHSDYQNERGYHLVGQSLLGAVGYLLLIVLRDTKALYASACIATMGVFSCIPLSLGWLNNNMCGSTKAATATAVVISFGNIGGVISGQLYRKEEAPHYTPSHAVNMGMLLLTCIVSFLLKRYLIAQNSKSDMANGPESKSTAQFQYTL
ncbi:putative nicotinamide mononucleotide transmembrane transporter protein [Basidiobolus meristosporus CBS 931.73]|uniref:Putative nicotinamide mononucleotide transmembrane transporter protein n=1 Tax=Basidiobolus meristosporus CBS 931.73 TaxID=1314790 RepID=A0A1Y1YXU3_9FUNG|nr:putative nicotinamide mononucleotide transmembrane transporter protein [Basidiobolus meristosporus CBS 931.73]|eukprot:ORY02799.1 putative nicotinamide mononucleotide transmembrane transporter protein [Basidiobolus meristosporus CBS 931.73]